MGGVEGKPKATQLCLLAGVQPVLRHTHLRTFPKFRPPDSPVYSHGTSPGLAHGLPSSQVHDEGQSYGIPQLPRVTVESWGLGGEGGEPK